MILCEGNNLKISPIVNKSDTFLRNILETFRKTLEQMIETYKNIEAYIVY